MRKIIIASHHKLASGMKDTLNYITSNMATVTAISAYLSNVPVEEEITAALADVTAEDEVLVFTDLLGGSVNQAFFKYLNQPHFHVIAGMNLPVILTLILGLTEDYLTAETIELAIAEAQAQIVYVNQYAASQAVDEDDE